MAAKRLHVRRLGELRSVGGLAGMLISANTSTLVTRHSATRRFPRLRRERGWPRSPECGRGPTSSDPFRSSWVDVRRLRSVGSESGRIAP